MADDRLTTSELATLLVAMEQAVQSVAAGMKTGMAMVGALFFGFALIYGLAFGSWAVAGFCAAFGAGIVAIGVVAARKTSPEKMQPVLDAVRDAPERITLIRHYQTSDSRRMFVTDWLEVRTAEHRLIIKAKDRWVLLHGMLVRRCPQAKLVDR